MRLTRMGEDAFWDEVMSLSWLVRNQSRWQSMNIAGVVV